MVPTIISCKFQGHPKAYQKYLVSDPISQASQFKKMYKIVEDFSMTSKSFNDSPEAPATAPALQLMLPS